jgi:membrane fusion protein, heavy metal efflux system
MKSWRHSFSLLVLLAILSGCGGEEPSHSSAATLPISTNSANKVQSLIQTEVVSYSSGHPTLALAGRIAYGEDRYSKISSPLPGRVIEVRARLGDRVNAGDVLLVIDSPEIAQAYSEFVKEHSELTYSMRAYELAKDLYGNRALPLKDLKQAENDLIKARAEFRRAKEHLLSLRVPSAELEKPLDRQRITSRFEMKSPLTGRVVERSVTPGQSVSDDPNQILFTIADLGTVQAVGDLYERDLALLKVAQVAQVQVEAYPGEDFPAAVVSIGDVVDPITRTIKVRALVNNEHHRLKPEMFARLYIDVSEGKSFITVPKEAVMVLNGKEYVYVMGAEGRYAERAVKVTPTTHDLVWVLKGLAEGDRIVTKGAIMIKAE